MAEVSEVMREESGLRVAKVFNKSDLSSLSKLNHVLAIRQKLVGRKVCLTRSTVVNDIGSDALFADADG